MIDQVVIHILSGTGGNGAISGRREKYVPMGGPDGGSGGTGGGIYFVADQNVTTLLSFRYQRRFVAGSGGNGMGGDKHGKNGTGLDVAVPVGTQVWREDDGIELLVDLASPGERVLIARGGKGGRGNASYASPTNRFPRIAEAGEPGEEMTLRLELKLLADVGVIGVPNAGKSSLLRVVSAARPKVAAYPFTTLEPALGVVEHHDESFVMVDIPGLIEGAHEGIGLGHDFLRHIERTRVLVHLVDGSVEDPIKDFEQINQELGLFNEDLLDKPQIIAVNKIDLEEARERMDELRDKLGTKDEQVYFISAATTEGIDELLDRALLVLQETPVPTVTPNQGDELPVLRPRPRGRRTSVVVEDGVYVVDSPVAARVAVMVDASDWTAKMQFYQHLVNLGVISALEEAGAGPGDSIRIGDIEWEWTE